MEHWTLWEIAVALRCRLRAPLDYCFFQTGKQKPGEDPLALLLHVSSSASPLINCSISFYMCWGTDGSCVDVSHNTACHGDLRELKELSALESNRTYHSCFTPAQPRLNQYHCSTHSFFLELLSYLNRDWVRCVLTKGPVIKLHLESCRGPGRA